MKYVKTVIQIVLTGENILSLFFGIQQLKILLCPRMPPSMSQKGWERKEQRTEGIDRQSNQNQNSILAQGGRGAIAWKKIKFAYH